MTRTNLGVKRSRRRRITTVITAFLAACLIISGCGGEDDSLAGSGGSNSSGGSNGAGGAPNASGTLRVGVATNVQTFDPMTAAGPQEYYLAPVFDTLIHTEPDGTFSPGLAEEWEAPDRNTFILHLRPDVTFSDGTPLDADAVVANFERGRSMETSPARPFYDNLEDVEAVDELTVRMDLVRPTTEMQGSLGRLPGMMMSPASFDADPDNRPIGAGGWTLDSGASNQGEVQVFRANPDYWDPSRVLVETIEMRVLEADAANNAMLGDQIDIIELRSEADTATFEGGGFDLISRPNANLWCVAIMDSDGSLLEPMGDVRVRQALNLAIDREAFDEGLQLGQGDPSPSVWLEGTPHYDESLEEWAYDPDRARELLAEAGYPDGFSVTFPSFGAIVPVAESIQQMWAEIGIDVSIDLVEPGTLAEVMRNGKTVMNPTLLRGITPEGQYKSAFEPGAPYDIGTDRGDMEELAEIAFQAETEEEQDDAWREVYKYAVDQGYVLVIGHQFAVAVVAPGIDGAVLQPSDNIPKPYGISVED